MKHVKNTGFTGVDEIDGRVSNKGEGYRMFLRHC